MNTYLLVSTIVFGLLSLIWKSSNYLNAFIKFVLIVLTIAGLLCFLKAIGVILVTGTALI